MLSLCLVRFAFDDEAVEVLVSKGNDSNEAELARSGENFVVGGRNRWSYKSITEWYFLPNRLFPVLMYFKETQTKPEGQSHLFPVIMDSKILEQQMTGKVGPSK
jgi:hypothetical protein